MKKFPIQLSLGIQHFLVDAICAASLLGTVRAYCGDSHAGMFMLVVLIGIYNVLAFCTQWFTGWCCDHFKNDRLMHLISAFALAAGTLLCRFFPGTGVVLVGLGNSLFHVAGGRFVILHSNGKAAPLGLFVAPGAIGLYLGGVLSGFSWLFCIFMMINTFAIWIMLKNVKLQEIAAKQKFSFYHVLAIILILVCISCRAASGTIPFPGKNIPEYLAWLPVLMIFAGKAFGGFAGDRLGYTISGVIAFLSGTLILVLIPHPAGYIAGQLLVNLLMPLTLWQIVKAVPGFPGLAFGLAATVLVPGSYVRFTREPINVFWWLSGISLLCFILTQMIIRNKKI